jgi:hypothetical protein
MTDSPQETFAPENDPEIAALLDFEPVPVKPRVNGWDPEAQRAFIALLAVTGSKGRAANAIGRNPGGIDRMLKRDDADAFRKAYDSAMALFHRKNAGHLADGYSAASATRTAALDRPRRAAALAEPLPGQVMNELGEWEDEASFLQRAEEAKDSIAMKLLRIRRVYLQEISASPGKRAAFEILTELPVDWDVAAAGEPQEFEPWTRTNARQPDMILTAESGWSYGDIGYGPDKKAQARKAIDQYRAEHGMEPINWDE